jgi:hypothetical protein
LTLHPHLPRAAVQVGTTSESSRTRSFEVEYGKGLHALRAFIGNMFAGVASSSDGGFDNG